MSADGWLIVDVALTFVSIFVVACALEARTRGRSPVVWGLIGLVANLAGFLVLMALPVRSVESAFKRP